MNRNVLILVQGTQVAASRYRILQYVPYLEESGVECTVRDFPTSLKEYLALLSILPLYECVFIQRKRIHFPFLQVFRRKVGKIIYDVDDAVMFRNSRAKSPHSLTRRIRFKNMVRNSDIVIAGNTFLQEQASRYHSRVIVIPTAIPAERYSLKDYSAKKDVVTIGWIGDHGSIHYLEQMRGIWDEMGKRYAGKVELKIICDTFFECEHMPVRKVQWSFETEADELKDIDIGVMPLQDDLWSWGKCGLKILQYYAAGVPAVCTPVGVNRDIVEHGYNGYWAKTEEEWVDALSDLIPSMDKRREMGLAGRKVLEKNYTREVNAPRILSSIIDP